MDIEYEISIGRFQLECIENRKSNAKHCVEQKVVKVANNRYYYEGKEIFKMTPQEELFAKLFNGKKTLVKDMDVLSLRAHREELALTIFKAKAEITAVDDEIKQKTKTKKGEGFQTSLTIDEASSDAINTIKERQGKLTKMDKVRLNLIEMGMSPEDAQSMTSNTAIDDLRRKKEGVKSEHQFTSVIDKNVNEATKPKEPAKPFTNPFAKKIVE